jgi:predicted acyltransferase
MTAKKSKFTYMKERIISLDVLRGITIMMMVLVNNPGSWGNIFAPLEHAEWNGCTPTDLVFPFFIFILGAAIPLAIVTKVLNQQTFIKILTRSLRIICLGLFLSFFGKIELFDLEGYYLLLSKLIITGIVAYVLLGNFEQKVKFYLVLTVFSIFIFLAFSGIEAYHDVRLPGVLQRIGVVYFFASLVYLKTDIKGQIFTVALLLLGYWAVMTLVPVPSFGAANLEKGTNLAGWLDNLLLENHLYSATKTWDPEGILSTIPAIANGIVGLLVGQLLNSSLAKKDKATKMFSVGLVLVILGLIWNEFFPMNKSLWTSSFVLYTAGLATLFLTAFYYLIDIQAYKTWTTPLLFWGVNPMIVFFLSGILPRVLSSIQVLNPEYVKGNLDEIPEKIGLQGYLNKFCILPHFDDPKVASLMWALLNITFWSLVLWYFYKKKLFFKV